MQNNYKGHEFIKKFRELFKKIEIEVRDEEKKSNVFSKIKNYFIDFCSLAVHFPYYFIKKMNNIKTTAEELEYNKLIKETWYRNEERLFRVLSKMSTDLRYIRLLKSDEFKSFIKKNQIDNWMPEEAIGLTSDFIESIYFSDLVRNKNFIAVADELFKTLPDSIREGLKIKLVNQIKRLDFIETQYGGSDSSMADQIKGGLGIAGGLVGGLAIGVYISVLLAFAIAAVPVILYTYNYYKYIQIKGQKDNLSMLIKKMEEAEKKNKDHKESNETEK